MEEAKVKPKVIKNAVDNCNTSCNTSIINAGYKSNEGDNIKVYLRIRPPSKEIQDVDNDLCLEVSSSNSLKLATRPEPKQFSYDHVAGMETTQEEVFSTVGKGIIEAFIDGFNGTIFAYGQTGSGKTFTMIGPADDSDNFSHGLRGVIPRGFEYIFSLINRQQDKVGDRIEFLAKCSFLEIYNESVYDLLQPSTAGLALRENIKKGVFAEGLTERTIMSAKDAYKVLQSGWLNRRVASTSMNRESSRSHAVFTVSLESKTRSGGVANIKESKLHLVDLAGSERQKDTHTVDVRLKEAGSINKSLSALGNVIMALVDIAHGRTRYIHYRDSKLTFILRDSLGGNAKTYIIANVHPSSKCFGETLSTLNFARRAKMIKNNAVVNEDVTGNVSELQAEIKKLKELLQAQSQSSGSMLKETDMQDIPIGTPSTVSYAQLSDDATQWQQMMLSAIAGTENAEKEKLVLQEKIEKLEEIGAKKDKFLQSNKMILKFRTQHINKLERKLKKELGPVDDESEKDRQIKLLKDEIKCLQASIEHHPDVKKIAGENMELRSEIRQLKALDPSNGCFKKEMAENHRYIMQLERQLREFMTTNATDLSNSQSLEASHPDVETMKMELAQIKVKLESTQNDLQEERKNAKQATEEHHSKIEMFRNKEMELQCNLAASEKAKNELGHNLESFQLKTVIERTTMNSLHMQTVKTLVSPRNFASPRKFGMLRTPSKLIGDLKISSTPHKKEISNGDINGSTNIQNKSENKRFSDDLEDVSPPKCMLHSDSFHDYSDSDEKDVSENTDETHDAETIYIEVLQEELSQVQKLYNAALETLNKEQKKQLPLKENLTKFEIKVKELEEILKSERSSFSTKESELSAQLVLTKDKYKETFGNSAVLKSEVEDLRIMYKSMGNQLDAAVKQKDEAHIEDGRKYAALESKYTELQIDYYNLRGEMEQTEASNNNILSYYEQCKEELQFTHHKNAELKDMISQEKSKVKEAQDAMEKMEAVMSLESTLSQEDMLRGQLHDLTKLSEEHEVTIIKQKAELEQSRSEVVEQKRLNLADKEVINNFMKTVEDLNVTIIEKGNLVISLQSEIQDFKKEQEVLRDLYDKDEKCNEKIVSSLKCECEKLIKEKDENEKKCVNLQEEMQRTYNKHTELTCTLNNNHQQQIQSLQTENTKKESLLNEKNRRILMLEENLVKLNQKTENSIISPENYITCNENFNNLSESWDTLFMPSLGMENKLADKTKKYESDCKVLESRICMLEMELDDSESRLKEKQDNIREIECKMSKLELLLAEKVILLEKTLTEKKNLLVENKNLQKDVEKLKMNLCNIQEDLHVNCEEFEKTKALEQKYFDDNNQLQSKLAVVEEEKSRFAKQIKQLLKKIDALEVDKVKLVAHKNANQRIDHLVTIKKENNTLREEVRTLNEKLSLKC